MFNEIGFIRTQFHDLATKCDLSFDELTEIYPTKSDLMQSIHRYMLKTLEQTALSNKIFEEQDEGVMVLKRYFEYMNRFRFFYLETMEVFRICPKIKEIHRNQITWEINTTVNLNKYALDSDLLVAEPFKNCYEILAQNIWLISNGWLQAQKIKGDEFDSVKAVLSVLQIVYPYLTRKGEDAYRKLVTKLIASSRKENSV